MYVCVLFHFQWVSSLFLLSPQPEETLCQGLPFVAGSAKIRCGHSRSWDQLSRGTDIHFEESQLQHVDLQGVTAPNRGDLINATTPFYRYVASGNLP